jgi:phosphoribosylaminoimidazole-succinocarboxamide synthase
MSEVLYESEVPGLKLAFRGKVRDVYDLGSTLLIVTTDRLSAFDVVLPTPIPEKGRVLNTLSQFWFGKMASLAANHLSGISVREVVPAEWADRLEPRSVVVKKATPLPVEAIVRGYLSGSGWSDYKRTGSVCGVQLPSGLRESDRLPEPIFTPSTKAAPGEHDQNIAYARAEELLGAGIAARVRELCIAVYRRGAEWAEQRGIIIADTKLEFGILDGEVILIDEVLTPDSSRFWPADRYEPGKSPPSFDKQYVRDYLTGLGWDKRPPAPSLPADVVAKTTEKYCEALHRLTSRR